MRKNSSIIFALIAWFAVITQFYLMLEHRVASVTETTIRFFSFFTILTNTLVAIYFSYEAFKNNTENKTFFNKGGFLTALTMYITIVGLVYQIALRHMWNPQGLDRIVDELLHSVIPLLVIGFWYAYENKKALSYNYIPKWLIYPFVYLIYILIRGSYSGFYPYPFVNVNTIGAQQVLINAAVLILFFIGMSVLFVFIGKKISKS